MSERRSELKAVSAAAEPAKMAGVEVTQMAAQWVDNWNQINGRLVSFAQTSVRNSISAAEQLRQCQSPTELVDAQIRLARQAYDDYLDEARQLSELVGRLSSEAIASAGAAAQSR